MTGLNVINGFYLFSDAPHIEAIRAQHPVPSAIVKAHFPGASGKNNRAGPKVPVVFSHIPNQTPIVKHTR